MRRTQPYGLPDDALTYLDENAIRANPCEKCGCVGCFITKELGTYGMFDELHLLQYEIQGGYAYEEIQHEVWSSGPMIWLRLVTPDGVFSWEDHEMEDYPTENNSCAP